MKNERWRRWFECSLCEQEYYGNVLCALGWACWKTYLGRPEEDWARSKAMNQLGNGLFAAKRDEESLIVSEADLATRRRLGASEARILTAQGNLALTYQRLGRREEALCMRRDVYSGRLKLKGEEHESTLRAASNYAADFYDLQRFEEAKSLLRKTMPVARRVLGDSKELTIRIRSTYAMALCGDPNATLDDLREAVTTLEETERIARRVLGGAHPEVAWIVSSLRRSRAKLRAREETPSSET